VAGSALRRGSISTSGLVDLAATVPGTGAPQCRRVAAEADARAANPFESVLRAIAVGVAGLEVVPQAEIKALSFSVQPDLVDVRRRIALEADSFAWHDRPARARCGSEAATERVRRAETAYTAGHG
jgi:hypothetical protein